jgi:hypothetical protein
MATDRIRVALDIATEPQVKDNVCRLARDGIFVLYQKTEGRNGFASGGGRGGHELVLGQREMTSRQSMEPDCRQP